VTLNWRQAITSALVGGAIGAVVTLILRGSVSEESVKVILGVALMIGGSRLIEFKKS
jgi:gas vesicle protein